MPKEPTTDIINCGYGRVAVRLLSQHHITKAERVRQFQAMFKSTPGYFTNHMYFTAQQNMCHKAFDCGCQAFQHEMAPH